MKSDLIEKWTQDELIIASRYREKILEAGLDSAKSLGQRTCEHDWRFHSFLFEDISIEDSISILDIGCGKAELLSFLRNSDRQFTIDRYLGLDLVEEFLNLARSNYPEHEFQQGNFVSDRFLPKQTFTIVVGLGVLVSRVRHYPQYVEYFINKMVQCSSNLILFNIISEVNFSSPNYSNYMQVGHSTFFPRNTLESILDKIDNLSYRIVEKRIFPDATDLFVRISIEK